jgi:hypothetical protein
MLIGGMAMKAWGRARLTKDVDFAVDRANQDRLLIFAQSLGYETLHVSEAFSNHVHPETRYGRLDFMYLAGETASRFRHGESDRAKSSSALFCRPLRGLDLVLHVRHPAEAGCYGLMPPDGGQFAGTRWNSRAAIVQSPVRPRVARAR